MMSPLSKLTVIFLLIPHTQGWFYKVPEVCYGDLGCFPNSLPFYNTLHLLPRSPEIIDTKFTLYTRDLTSVIDHENLQNITVAKQIKVIVHGYISSEAAPWVQIMIQELLTYYDYYVITVDWSNGADVNYFQAAADTRLIGAELARLLNAIKDVKNILPGDVHIIGHSFGAHIAGYAGEIMSGIGRITGLDPAGPAFEYWPEITRLDKNDAVFVDVIHTDGDLVGGIGMMRAVGHIDFYPNGGKVQPGCTQGEVDIIEVLNGDIGQLLNLLDLLLCSHRRSYYYFIESINSLCPFTSYPCDTIDDQSSANCNACGTGCALMGFHAAPGMNHGKYFLQTNAAVPFCIA
ncbi:inactive pancreatic lipase-related protein 1-like isoform X2 [Ruditapes philippinarum]|uniref:inactive pancreatic lipase-related protein 1-like isoform X2 n=1 Tax=Ruditapes philippinarum TaxID=129788 RepID=UPI00295B5E46|nr:inactive pancreatic lipase-related protein 1-like isoform X2 [Ruditapes philippinarum]